MAHRLRPTIRLFSPESWQAEVALAVAETIPTKAQEYLKKIPGADMYADTMEYMNDAFAEASDHFGNYVRERLVQTVLGHFAYFRSYHGCRPFSLESYFQKGLLLLSRERLAEIAFELFEGTLARDEITHRAESADLQTRLGRVYFMADADELVSYCGHYLIYGPESLCCLWHGRNDRDHALFLESKERYRNRGVPTVLECDVPVGWIPATTRMELANTLVTHFFQLQSQNPVPANEWSRNWGYSIRRTLPARYIRNHFHPETISDPLRSMSRFHNPHLRCAWCKPGI